MRRIALIVGVALLVHLVATIALPPYLNLIVDLGEILTPGNDIADIPRFLAVGFTVLAIAIGAAVAATALYIGPAPQHHEEEPRT